MNQQKHEQLPNDSGDAENGDHAGSRSDSQRVAAPNGARVATQSPLWRYIRLVASTATLLIGVAAKAAGILNWVELGFGILGLFGLIIIIMILEQIQITLAHFGAEVHSDDLGWLRRVMGRIGPGLLYVFSFLLGAVGIGLVVLGLWYSSVQVGNQLRANDVLADTAEKVTKMLSEANQTANSVLQQANEKAEMVRREAGIPSRVQFASGTLDVHPERADVQWGQTTGDPLSEDENSLYRRSMDDWFHWLRRGGGPAKGEESTQLLVVRLAREKGFEHFYNDIRCVVYVSSQLVLEQGVCFLVKQDPGGVAYRPVYRQMPFKIVPDESGVRFKNELTLVRPDEGEQILMVLRVRRTDGMACETDPTWYGVRLVVP